MHAERARNGVYARAAARLEAGGGYTDCHSRYTAILYRSQAPGGRDLRGVSAICAGVDPSEAS